MFVGRLERLGYSSYAAYLKSAHWHDVRARYADSERPQECGLCGADEELHLHHLTYERLGAELLTDLVRLCRHCHAMVHVLERRGDASISLDGLASDERATAYFAQREAAIERSAAENAQPRQAQPLDKADLETLNREDPVAARKAWFTGLSKAERRQHRRSHYIAPAPDPIDDGIPDQRSFAP